MASMLQEWNDLFQALLFGNGSWIALIVIEVLIIAIMAKWKYSGVLFIPICIFMGIEYLNYNLGWQALIMFFSTLFMSVYMIKEVKG